MARLHENPLVGKLKKIDENLSHFAYSRFKSNSSTDAVFKFLEFSCHVLTLIVVIVTALCLWPDSELLAQLVVGILFDSVIVAIIKAYSRRVSPSYAKDAKDAAEKQSFPSGHASKAVYLAMALSRNAFAGLLLWTWAAAVLASRIVSGKHFVGDVIAGAGVGYLEYQFQFGLGSGMFRFLVWLVQTSLGMPFSNTNDLSDAQIGGDLNLDDE